IVLGKPWPVKISPTGLTIASKKQLMYIVTKENNSLYVVDIKSKSILKTVALGAEAFTCLLSPDEKVLYISLWGNKKVLVFDTNKQSLIDSIQVGDHPNELLLTRNGKRLFVANANDNSVSVIDTRNKKVTEVLSSALYPGSPPGSTTNGLALTPDEKTLFIANADNNCLAVFDVSVPVKSKSRGFIPVGWYPTNIKVIGKKIYVANGKGMSSRANPNGPNPTGQSVVRHADSAAVKTVEYIGGLFKGTLSIIQVPTEEELAVYSTVVYGNTPYHKDRELLATGEAGNPIPSKIGDSSPVKYVFYIIKENRTYDQVLGDMREGNGDSSLTLFGERITPNHHAIARQFVLLDNFYVDGEVSMDGHNWSMGAYATDYLEKTWPTSYGGRGGDYSGEGQREMGNNKGGFIWDHCAKAGVTYRTYGEFVDNHKANIPVLEHHFCPYYPGYDLKIRDTLRYNRWQQEFDSLLAKNAVPRFNSLRFSNDHTEGMRLGSPTPFAHVADNDLAIGLFLEHLSKSSLWEQSVVFIVEDDAQNGPDHVDAHRTVALVAGGYVKRGFVDHTMYSTSSILRTLELILGIPPMTQYDAAATPMWRSFQKQPDLRTYTARPNNIDLNEKNTARNSLSERSAKFDLSKEDKVPDLEFNEVLWYGVKGMDVPFPGPKRSSFLKLRDSDEDDD
ncbi:MAG TPA: bifunctional YncE family protein/alkaline phosphatase family protein, partial [Agriterribacter sp.]|nr:bifunctional YncE family protein/alkaline phosphatase family protein [Agriterribacter sp.]